MSSNTIAIIVGLMMIAVAFIIFPMVLTGTNTILAWTASDNTTISQFTGLETIVKIAPTLVFLVFLFGGGFLSFQGFRSGGGGKAGRGLH